MDCGQLGQGGGLKTSKKKGVRKKKEEEKKKEGEKSLRKKRKSGQGKKGQGIDECSFGMGSLAAVSGSPRLSTVVLQTIGRRSSLEGGNLRGDASVLRSTLCCAVDPLGLISSCLSGTKSERWASGLVGSGPGLVSLSPHNQSLNGVSGVSTDPDLAGSDDYRPPVRPLKQNPRRPRHCIESEKRPTPNRLLDPPPFLASVSQSHIRRHIRRAPLSRRAIVVYTLSLSTSPSVASPSPLTRLTCSTQRWAPLRCAKP